MIVQISKRLILIGGGSFSAEIAEVASMLGYDVIGYLDVKITNSRLRYLGTVQDYLVRDDVNDFLYFPAFGAIDRDSVMRRVVGLNSLTNLNVPTLISPNAFVSDDVVIGQGSYIAHGVVINRSSEIAPYVIINTNTTIGHNVKVLDNTIVSGNVFVGGGCCIGSNTLVGPGSILLHGITVGAKVIISLGSVVGRSIGDGKTTIPVLSKVI